MIKKKNNSFLASFSFWYFFQGNHPTEIGVIVERYVGFGFTLEGDPDIRDYDKMDDPIQVVKCKDIEDGSEYFVYQLPKTPESDARYCGTD